MLLVLFGNSPTAPLPLKLVRLFCRGLGAALLLLSALVLGHVSAVRLDKLHLGALTSRQAFQRGQAETRNVCSPVRDACCTFRLGPVCSAGRRPLTCRRPRRILGG
jgi:hypothetical protein